jgi:hypothetical protein
MPATMEQDGPSIALAPLLARALRTAHVRHLGVRAFGDPDHPPQDERVGLDLEDLRGERAEERRTELMATAGGDRGVTLDDSRIEHSHRGVLCREPAQHLRDRAQDGLEIGEREMRGSRRLHWR